MDTSKQFIAMCDCKEVQDNKPHAFDDDNSFYVHYEINLKCPDCGCQFYQGEKYCPYDRKKLVEETVAVFEKIEDDSIWLPRQDQIQEMIEIQPNCWWTGYDRPHALLNQFIYGIGTDDGFPDEYYVEFRSMEQIWLAFYMQEKHNKVWDGTEWKTAR